MPIERVDLTKGLNEYFEASTVPEGYATTLQNWVPEANGALRVDRGWQSASTSSLSGTRSARGIQVFVPDAGAEIIMAQASGATTYDMWALERSNIASGSWNNFNTGVTVTSTNYPVAIASGMGKVLYCTQQFPSSQIRGWDGTTDAVASTDAVAGRCLVFHNNRFFSGGTTANPTYLNWSELTDSSSWATSVNFQPISDDDGEPVEDLASWERALFIGKERSIWSLTGYGPTSFSFRQMNGGGVAPGRTLVPTPTGVIAIGRERVYQFLGGGFEPISQPIESSYGMTGNYMTGCYIDGRVYICDNGSGTVWVYDVQRNAWWTETFASTSEGPGHVAAAGSYLFGGAKAASANSILLYREEPGGARERADGSGQTFTFVTPDYWLGEGVAPVKMLQVYLQIRQRGTTGTTPLSISVDSTKSDGSAATTQTETIAVRAAAGVFRKSLTFAVGGRYNIRFTASHAPTTSENVTFDIERMNYEVSLLEARKGQQ